MSPDYVGAPDAAGDFILRDVTVVDATDGSHAAGQDIRVSGGTIAASGGGGQDPAGLRVVDGAFVVPGYVDGHALNDPGTAPGSYALMLANGVTGFRQMSGSAKLLAGRLPAPPGSPRCSPCPARCSPR